MSRPAGGEEDFGAMGLVCPIACRISALLAGGIITYKGATLKERGGWREGGREGEREGGRGKGEGERGVTLC
jgi:hypothetical protein